VSSPLKRGAAFGAFLSPQGRVLYDCLFYASKYTDESVYLDVHASLVAKVISNLTRHKLDLPLTIEETHLVVGAASSVPANLSAEIITQDPRWRKMPYRFLLPREFAEAEFPEGTNAYHKLRVQAGVPEGPTEFVPNESLPLNMNLDLLNGVSFNKGCYVGQELTTRTMRRGVIRRRVVGLQCDEQLTIGSELQCADNLVGKIFSVSGNRALAIVQTEAGDALNDRNIAADQLEKVTHTHVAGVSVTIVVPEYYRS
jgi:hypothetical protein